MIRNILFATIIAFYFAACTMIPPYNRPVSPVSSEWPGGPAYKEKGDGSKGQSVAEIGWREFYGDERLQEIIELALTNNRDLRIAALTIERAQAQYRISRSELLPSVGGAALLSEQRIPAETSQTAEAMDMRQYTASVGITAWEIDVFGRIRSLNESALNQYFATEQVHKGLQISLMAEIANLYLLRAADMEGLILAQSTLEARQKSLDLIQRRFDVGASSSLDVRQAQTLREAARVDVVRYTRLVALDENALSLLVGSAIPRDLLADELKGVILPKDVLPGLSSEVLLKRPDVMRAEYLLKAANANIGAARATMFPRISLTTTMGTVSPDLAHLFKVGSGTWLFAPQVSVPIFDARIRAAYDVTKVDRGIYVAQYEKTIQTAFKEVADSLTQRGTIGDQIAAQESLVAATQDAYRLSNARYTRGIDNFLVVLDVQRSLYTAQLGLISLRLSKLNNLVTLYKVLGGWADVQ
jgi:outer membrane protein, multidrug efflux system